MEHHGILHLLSGPIGGVLALWILSAILHAMPAPKPTSGTAYVWFYNAAQILGVNLSRINFSALFAKMPVLSFLMPQTPPPSPSPPTPDSSTLAQPPPKV